MLAPGTEQAEGSEKSCSLGVGLSLLNPERPWSFAFKENLELHRVVVGSKSLNAFVFKKGGMKPHLTGLSCLIRSFSNEHSAWSPPKGRQVANVC